MSDLGKLKILVDLERRLVTLERDNQVYKELFKALYSRNPVPGWKSKLLRLGIDIDDTQSRI